MNIFNKLIVLMIFMFNFTVFLGWYIQKTKTNNKIENVSCSSNDMPPSMQLYYHIMKYSKEYNVPIDIAFGVAHHESGYEGPFDWSYNPKLISSANAYGAMQIQVPTANNFSDKIVTSSDLLNNLELNVNLSMKILSFLYKNYHDWHLALGAYNTGKPIINGYALNIVNFNSKTFLSK